MSSQAARRHRLFHSSEERREAAPWSAVDVSRPRNVVGGSSSSNLRPPNLLPTAEQAPRAFVPLSMQKTEEEKLAEQSSTYEELEAKTFACQRTNMVVTDCDTSDAEACKLLRERGQKMLQSFDILTDAATKDKGVNKN